MWWLALALVACQHTRVVNYDEAERDAGDSVFVPPEPPANGVQIEVVGEPLGPGEEVEFCHYVQLDNAESEHLSAIEVAATQGLHHSVLWRTSVPATDGDVPCFGLPEDEMTRLSDLPVPLFGTSTQVDAAVLEFPAGVAAPIDPMQQLIVNVHYANYTRQTVTPNVFLNLTYAAAGTVDHTAQMYVFGNLEIAIPASGSQKLSTTCTFPDDANLLTLTPHTHELGQAFSAHLYDGATESDLLFSTRGWSDQDTRLLGSEAGLPILAGQGLAFTCEWSSDRNTLTTFGHTAADEMCFAFGHYYPAERDLSFLDGDTCRTTENQTW